MDHGCEAVVGLVAARCDATELLEITEEVLDQMTPSVHREIALDIVGPVGLGRDHRERAAVVEFLAQPVMVEALVGDEGANLDPVEQRFGADAVVALARQQQETGQVAKRIDQGDDLGGQAAPRPPDGLSLRPPFAPVPCWWTRTMVPSMRAYSKSGSPANSLNRRSNTPFSSHRRKRLNTEFQFPNAKGRSRHGAPARAIHSTASRKARLSRPDRPGSPCLAL